MRLPTKRCRKITVDGKTYLWMTAGRARYIGNSPSAIRIFVQEESENPGVPIEVLLVTRIQHAWEDEWGEYGACKAAIHPSDVEKIIRYGFLSGWKPNQPAGKPLQIKEGFLDLWDYKLPIPKWWRMIVKKKDGKSFCGSLVEWRPKDGWFSITDDEFKNHGQPIRIYLGDVESAIEKDHREHDLNTHPLEDVDVLERAKRHGWRKGEANGGRDQGNLDDH